MSIVKSFNARPVKVLHVIGVMNRGGAETMIMNLYRNIDRTKIQFDFVENTGQTGIFEKEITELGGRIFHCPHFNGKNVLKYRKWWDAFFDTHQDEYIFVHGHIGSTAAIYLASAKKHGIKTIAHSHNKYGKVTLNQTVYKLMSYPTRYIADYLFACSEEAGISRYGNKHSFVVLNNAIDTKRFSYNNEKKRGLRNYLKIDVSVIVYGHIGRFENQKNHAFLLDIFQQIINKQENSVLVMIGDGINKDKIRNKAEELGITEHIRFLGVREDVYDLLNCIDVLVFPSLFEGLPVTLVEAQSSGLRCLISDVISDEAVLVPELVTKLSLEKSACEWADKAIELSHYERRSYCKEVTEAGFDIQQNADWLQEFYLKEAGVYE